MSEQQGLLSRVVARVRAIFPEQWRGAAGKQYRETLEAVSDYSKKNVRIRERLDEAPDVIANTLKLKGNEALLKSAEEENKRIASELARQTLSDKARQEKATADRMETDARTAKIKEMQERLTLVEKLRAANCVPVWDKDGNMQILKAPATYNWDGLTDKMIQAADLSLPPANDTAPPSPLQSVGRSVSASRSQITDGSAPKADATSSESEQSVAGPDGIRNPIFLGEGIKISDEEEFQITNTTRVTGKPDISMDN